MLRICCGIVKNFFTLAFYCEVTVELNASSVFDKSFECPFFEVVDGGGLAFIVVGGYDDFVLAIAVEVGD